MSDRLTELGTARGHAQRSLESAELALETARAEYALRDFTYQRYIAGCEDCDAYTAAKGCTCPNASGIRCRCVDFMDTSRCPRHGQPAPYEKVIEERWG